MASTSTSASRPNATAARIKSTATTLYSDNQSLIAEIRKALIKMKGIAVDLERENHSQMPTDFKKLFDDEIAKSKGSSSSLPQNHPLLRHFREAIWNVHHAGQPMPGEEQEDIVMTSTQSNLLNVTCPLSGKPVTELADPARSMDCKHIYQKNAIMQYIKSKGAHAQCPMAGCPKILKAERVVCDPLLLIEIDEMRAMSKQTAMPEVIEDFTELDDD